MSDLDMRALWERALPYHQFVDEATENRGLWTGVYAHARIPAWALARACDAGSRYKLLVLAEDWCGDAANTVPYVARLGETAHCLEMRVLKRDENPELMDRHLTGTSRSIPVVIVLDEEFRLVGHWGPRPQELQAWVLANRTKLPRERLYPLIRRWYARDKGETTLRELLALVPNRQPPAASRRASTAS